MGSSSFGVDRIRYGLKLNWISGPPPVTTDHQAQVNSDVSCPRKDSLIHESIQKMLNKRAIRVVSDGYPGFYSHLFMVPKKGTDKWRPVIDLSTLNNYTLIPHFKMETAELIRASLQPQEWVTSVDLTDAYFHIPIRPRYCK